MATPNLSSSFISWNLSGEEFLQGCSFNDNQKKSIQNLISTYAEERLNLPLIEEHRDRSHELLGSILALRYILTLCETAEKAAEEVIQNNSQQP